MFVSLFINAQAQQDKARAYIENYKEIAIAEMQRTGVPAAITLAQGLVESGCGEGDLCKRSNNHFGIKCKVDWTGDKVYHDDDQKNECFRSYPSVVESYKDHSDFLKAREVYSFLFQIDPTDYTEWAKGLKKAGYATEKNYPQNLIKVINDYNLNQYSILALDKNYVPNLAAFQTKSDNDSTMTAQNKVPEKDTVVVEFYDKKPNEATVINDNKVIKSKVFYKQRQEDSVTIINPNMKEDNNVKSVKTPYPVGTFTINNVKVIYVQEGTSLLSIASKYDISLGKLLEYNDLDEIDITPTDQLIFLEKKQSKGSLETHVVKENENLYSICQIEGIKLEKVLEYNKLKRNSIVKIGDTLHLRPIIATSSTK
jgi:LysM repeat protein